MVNKDSVQELQEQKEEPPRIYLTAEEVKTVIATEMPKKHLQPVKDCIVFQIYTGIAYVDLKNLSQSNIIKAFDGKLWLEFKRQKTNRRTSLPLLPVELEILNKLSYTSFMFLV